MVGQRILVPSTGVRLSQSQPFATLRIAYVARSSSGLGRRPLKAEITSSNLVRATKCDMARSSSGLGRRPLKAEITSSNLVRATMNCKAGCFGGLPFLLRRQEARRVGGKSCKAVPDSGHLFLVAALGTTFCVGFIGL